MSGSQTSVSMLWNFHDILDYSLKGVTAHTSIHILHRYDDYYLRLK